MTTWDPVQLGQTLGAVALVAASSMAAIRKGLAGWKRGQDAAQLRERRALRTMVRAELGKHLVGLTGRLEHLERALAGQRAAPAAVSPKPRTPRMRKRARR